MKKLVNSCVTCLVVFASLGAVAQDDADLVTVMKGKLESILTAVETQNENVAAIDALAANVDFPAITRGVLGKYRDAVDENQRARFQGEFERSMLKLLRAALKTAGDYSIDVTGTRVSEKNQARAQAFATVTTGDKQKIQLVSSIAKIDDDWKVRNLILEGLNLGLTYRNQFDELMQANGNDVDKAIDAWAELVVAESES